MRIASSCRRDAVVLTVVTLWASATPPAAAGELTLVLDGRPAATIVIAEKPTRVAQLAALELQHHVKLISGAVLPIARDGAPVEGVRVLVGESAATRELSLASDDFAPQEYLVRFGKDTLVLIGRDEQDFGDVQYLLADDPTTWRAFTTWPETYHKVGTMYAVYEFLERFCDVRWFTPTQYGSDIPSTSTLTVAGNDIQRAPFFGTRLAMVNPMSEVWDRVTGLWNAEAAEFKAYEQIAYATLHETFPNPSHYVHAKRGWVRLWLFRMRNIGETCSCNHSLYGYYDRFWEKNERTPDWFVGKKPDIFAKGYEGKPPQMCFTSHELVQLVAQDARDYFDGKVIWHNTLIRKDRREAWGENMFAIEPMDNGSFCKCDACAQWFPPGTDREAREYFGTDRDSDYIFQFVNAVARELAKTHPDQYVCTLAYGSHLGYPDKVKMEPNVIVFFCYDHNRLPYHTDEYAHEERLYREWVDRHDGPLYLWLYYCFPQDWGRGQWRVFPGFFAHTIGEQFRTFQRDGIKGMFHCGYGQEVESYVTFKLMDDPTRSVDGLLDEWFTRQYGSAGQPLRRFYEDVESIYANPANYYDQRLTHQTEEIAWGMLGTQKRMEALGQLIEQARALVRTDAEKARLDLFEQTTWNYMTSGKDIYHKRKAGWAQIPRLRGFLSTLDNAGGDPGKVDWREATSLTGWRLTNVPENSFRRLRGRLKHDGTYLYLCLDEWLDTSTLVEDGEVTGGDYFQVILAAGRSGARHEWLINPGGRTLGRHYPVSDGPWSEWNGSARVVSERKPDRWTVKISVPLETCVPGGAAPGSTVFLNLARRRAGGADDAVWVPTLKAIEDTGRLAQVTLDTQESTLPADPVDAAGLAELDRQRLSARWSFEEPMGTDVKDTSGNAHDGTVTHRVGRGEGIRGACLVFDVDQPGRQAVDIGNPPGLNLTDALTLEAWIWPNEDFRSFVGYYPAVVGKGYADGPYSLHLRTYRTPWFDMTTADGKRHFAQPAGAPLIGQEWNHVAAVYDGSRMRIYVNGREAGTPVEVTGKLIQTDTPVTIGALPGCNPFVGKLDEVSIYARALTHAEIFARWRAGLTAGANGP